MPFTRIGSIANKPASLVLDIKETEMNRTMRLVFMPAIVFSMLLAAAAAPAAVVFDEHFNYATGPLSTANVAWVLSGAGSSSVTSPGLTHPELAGESGNAASLINARSTISLGTTFGDENEVVFLSFLMQTDSNQNTGLSGVGSFETIELYDGATRRYAIGLLRGDGNTGSAQFEQRAYQLTSSTTPDLGAFTAATNLFVAKFNYTSGGDALTIDAWLNPDRTTDFGLASNRITIASSAFDFTNLALAGFAQGATPDDVTFDEIRVASTPPTFVPEPASLALLGLGGLVGLLVLRRRLGLSR